eukprot:TRINITY_DN3947_c0_g1_i1.p1 TRINITY_DN3947_c0_g1~~TRINITY_DN3947_c0_g1_i1.p1  ORF type:complete len:268 (-),score=45.19 TRINITY_DN3947_c0_g1_i1:85-888(-)
MLAGRIPRLRGGAYGDDVGGGSSQKQTGKRRKKRSRRAHSSQNEEEDDDGDLPFNDHIAISSLTQLQFGELRSSQPDRGGAPVDDQSIDNDSDGDGDGDDELYVAPRYRTIHTEGMDRARDIDRLCGRKRENSTSKRQREEYFTHGTLPHEMTYSHSRYNATLPSECGREGGIDVSECDLCAEAHRHSHLPLSISDVQFARMHARLAASSALHKRTQEHIAHLADTLHVHVPKQQHQQREARDSTPPQRVSAAVMEEIGRASCRERV